MGDGQFKKLRIFLSWSGARSNAVAQAFRDWLPSVLQNVQPYYTPDDIEKGARWSAEIRGQLEATDFGVIFLTPDNLNAPWILFEAGALSKLDKAKVAPLLLGIEPAEVSGPLGQLQLTRFTQDDCFKLLSSINRSLDDMGLSPAVLDMVFNRAWPELEARVEAAMTAVVPQPPPKRSEREMIEEVLERVRAIQTGRSWRAHEHADSVWTTFIPLSGATRDPREISIRDLPGLSERAIATLEAERIHTVGDVMNLSERELLSVPNLGKKSFNELVQILGMLGYALKRSQ